MGSGKFPGLLVRTSSLDGGFAGPVLLDGSAGTDLDVELGIVVVVEAGIAGVPVKASMNLDGLGVLLVLLSYS